jgi:ribosome-associated protein
MSEDDTEAELLPSRTQLKKDSEALQKLGEEIIALQKHDLDILQLPEKLQEAVEVARRLNARSGLKRQKQYIGKIMREIDSDDIRQQLQRIRHRNDAGNAAFKKTENWRDRLINESNDAVTEVLNLYPQIERQHLNQLIRQAKKEIAAEKPPAASRKLFKYLRQFIDPEQLTSKLSAARCSSSQSLRSISHSVIAKNSLDVLFAYCLRLNL